MYPIVIERRGVEADSQGFGEFEGAPGVGGAFYPLEHEMTVIYAADATEFPARGVLGGTDARPVISRKQLADGTIVDLPSFHEAKCQDGEKMLFVASGGGGYGDPRRRARSRVADVVSRGWLSPEKALEVYGVALTRDAGTGEYRA
jgi:N-methylhydantoinase B